MAIIDRVRIRTLVVNSEYVIVIYKKGQCAEAVARYLFDLLAEVRK